MSKENFNKRVMLNMFERFKALEDNDFEKYLSFDETFEIALCLAYMTLSKEKIIKKDMKNTDRLERIERKVPTRDIDFLFNGSCKPTILSSRENDNTWILDNIRDSIMHECFDIDEENHCIMIHNKWYDRELEAIVPFEWFKKYIENDMLNKRITNHFTYRKFLYNPIVPKDKRMTSRYAVKENILLKIDVFGNKIPIKEIEEKIDTWLEELQEEEITNEDVLKYHDYYDHNQNYNKYYYIYYLKVKELLKEKIEKEYPNSSVKIYNDERKHKISNQSHRRLLNSYKNYDSLYQSLNSLFARKSDSLLNSIVELYDYINNNPIDSNHSIQKMKDIIELKNSGKLDDPDRPELVDKFYKEKNRSLLVFLHIYGLAGIVLNGEELKKNKYQEIFKYKIPSCSKTSYENYKNKKRKAIKSMLELRIRKTKLQENYKKCNTERKDIILELLLQVEEAIQNQIKTINELEDTFKPVIQNHSKEKQLKDRIMTIKKSIGTQKRLFFISQDPEEMKVIEKIILDLYDQLFELEGSYTFGECNPEETLEIIRNCFAHIGRVNCESADSPKERNITFSDYDNNNELSGIARTKYMDLLSILLKTCSDYKEKSKRLSYA